MLHKVVFEDIEFDRAAGTSFSSLGVRQVRPIRVGMPRIPRRVINSVFYLYESREDAEQGKKPGGTGFIVQYNERPGLHLYGVTNWHVACQGCSVIRINTKDGGTDIIDLDPSEWHFVPGKHDIAVVPLNLNLQLHEAAAVSTGLFAKPTAYRPNAIGVGDDAFMIGLFVDHGGAATNVPSARFGNVSMLADPNARIRLSTGYHAESFIVDMHSRTGFSGSPVFAYRTFGSELSENPNKGVPFDDLHIDQFQSRPIGTRSANPIYGRLSGYIGSRQMFRLLGIHWGQFPETWLLSERSRLIAEGNRYLVFDGAYVEGMSGMTCVAPAWQILEVLELPELARLREPEIFRGKQEQQHRARTLVPRPE